MKRISMAVLLFLFFLLGGCGKKDEGERIPVEMTVIAQKEIPVELQELIAEKEKEEFQLVFETESDCYLVKGYGQQKTSNYQIQVMECVETKKAIYLTTQLTGPEEGSEIVYVPSCPVLTVKIEKRTPEKSVVFCESSGIE